MYGYLKPFVPELKIKDYKTYQAFRCGLSRQLRKDYSLLSCRMLQKDMIVVAILCDSLAGREGTMSTHRYAFNRFRKTTLISQTKGIRLAARMQVLLTWQKLTEREVTATNPLETLRFRFWKMLLRSDYNKALQEDGALIQTLLLQETEHHAALAMTHCAEYSVASIPSENMFSSLFLHCASDEASWRSLRLVGMYVGRIYFMIRQIERYDYDKEYNQYNVFIENGLPKRAAIESAKRQCNLAAVELVKSFALLNLKINRTLLDNIVYLGLEHAVETLGDAQTTKEEAFSL